MAKRDVIHAAEGAAASRAQNTSTVQPVRSISRADGLISAIEVDVTDVLDQNERGQNASASGRARALLPFVTRAALDGIQRGPALNATVSPTTGQVVHNATCNLAITVDTAEGPVAGVLRNANVLSVPGLERRIADLSQRARQRRLSVDELTAATFAITGGRDVLFEAPPIRPPQAATLGVGSAVRRAAVLDHPELGEVIAVRWMVMVAVRFDERAVDGALAASFLQGIKSTLERARFDL